MSTITWTAAQLLNCRQKLNQTRCQPFVSWYITMATQSTHKICVNPYMSSSRLNWYWHWNIQLSIWARMNEPSITRHTLWRSAAEQLVGEPEDPIPVLLQQVVGIPSHSDCHHCKEASPSLWPCSVSVTEKNSCPQEFNHLVYRVWSNSQLQDTNQSWNQSRGLQ